MRTQWAVRGMGLFIVALIALAGFGQAVHYLWNWLMPTVFGLHEITFWQAAGLLGLSWILFGGFGRLGGRRSRRMYAGRRMAGRWQAMTPEQRASFREGMRGRCGHFETTAEEPKA
jgi:Ca2+/H+ antiporter, TMEM165/GDT1 family